MSETYGYVECDICSRAFRKYDKSENSKITGISLIELKKGGTKLNFVDNDKSEINRHICSYCISDILNKYQD